MIWLDPTGVTFGGEAIGGVSSIVVDRKAARVVAEWSDAGPHVVFADVPEQRVAVRVTRRIGAEGSGAFRPGDLGELSFRVGPSASDARVRTVTAQVVVESIVNRVDPRMSATQTIECVAISGDGAADPVVEQDAAA